MPPAPGTEQHALPDTHVFSVLTHLGEVHSSSPGDRPGELAVVSSQQVTAWETPSGAVCLRSFAPPGLTSTYRAVSLAKGVTWTDRGIYPGAGSEFRAQAYVQTRVTGDLLFYSMGGAGILTFRLDAYGREASVIGRFWTKDHSVYRLQADSTRGLLFAGGQDKDGNPIIDVWNLSQANGGPTASGVFPPASGEAIDPRLLATLKAPWDTNHIGLDETGLGLIYTWGYRPTPPAKPEDPPGREEGGFVVAFEAPSFTFSGVYRSGEDVPALGVKARSLQRLAPLFDPLGVPLRVRAEDESSNQVKDEACTTDAAAAVLRDAGVKPAAHVDDIAATFDAATLSPATRFRAAISSPTVAERPGMVRLRRAP